MKMQRTLQFSTLILVSGVLALSGSAFAKGRGKGRERSFPGPRMTQELNLTDAQVTKIKAIHEKNRERIESDRDERQKHRKARQDLQTLMQSDASKKELQAKFKATQPDCKKRQKMSQGHFEEILEIRDVLTPEQRKKFRGMMGKKKGKRGKRGGRKGMRGQGGSGWGDGAPPPPLQSE